MFVVKLSSEDLDVNPDHLNIIEENGIAVSNTLSTIGRGEFPQKVEPAAKETEGKTHKY